MVNWFLTKANFWHGQFNRQKQFLTDSAGHWTFHMQNKPLSTDQRPKFNMNYITSSENEGKVCFLVMTSKEQSIKEKTW